MSKKIPVSNGKVFTIVDDEDFEYLSKFKWQLRGGGYASRHVSHKITGGSYRYIYMHAEIIGKPPAGHNIDHLNRNKLDNQKSNLRFSSFSNNVANRSTGKNNTSGFKGVCWDKTNKKWQTNIRKDGKQKTIGRFDCPVEAAKAYNDAAKSIFGDFAYQNPV